MEHPEVNDRRRPPIAAPDEFAEGYAAATRAAGVRAIDGRIVVRATGGDRVPFFHGMCSADVKGAQLGTVLPALILTEHAHVIAELFMWMADDAILLDIDADAWRRARAHLDKLLVADDVEFEEADALSVIDIEGPDSPAAVRTLAGGAAEAPAPWRFVCRGDLFVGNVPRLGNSAVTVLAPRVRTEAIVTQILSAAPGAHRIDAAVIEALRIEHGIARVGVDTGDKTLALEAGMDRAISFSKGCYVGQETIERATARGALKKRMMGLRFEGGQTPDSGAEVTFAGNPAGHITSAAISPRLGAIGLAILHHSAWAPGTRVVVAARGADLAATVSALPFEG